MLLLAGAAAPGESRYFPRERREAQGSSQARGRAGLGGCAPGSFGCGEDTEHL